MTSKPKFKVGDVVRLRSGSPALTVTNIFEDNGLVAVSWISGTAQEAMFPAECLVEDEP